jgi:hypothetical protein
MRNRLITAVMATIALATFYYATGHQRLQPLGVWSAAIEHPQRLGPAWL